MRVLQRMTLARRAWAYFRDPQVALWRKVVGFAAVAYTLWPLDVIPDVIPGIGWLDDAGILGLAALFMVREIHRHQTTALTAPRPTP
jgi:uncharacterized membrane protein YkvA (DUF1232 family)